MTSVKDARKLDELLSRSQVAVIVARALTQVANDHYDWPGSRTYDGLITEAYAARGTAMEAYSAFAAYNKKLHPWADWPDIDIDNSCGALKGITAQLAK